jgi:methyl-accepting chemotaxis protein
MIKAERLAAEKEAENDVKMRRARVLDDLTRAFEAKVTELVGGLSSASATMEDTAQSTSSTAAAAGRGRRTGFASLLPKSNRWPARPQRPPPKSRSRSPRSRPPATRRSRRSSGNVADVIAEIDQIGTPSPAIEEQGSATKEISRSVQEAARGTQEVNSNISGVQQAADHTGSAANQVLGAAEQLSTQSRDLAGQFNRFLSEVRAA